MEAINHQKLERSKNELQKARLDHKNSRRVVQKEVSDNFNKYNTYRELYSTSLEVLKTKLNRYDNAQDGFEKGIYTDAQVLESKVDTFNL